MDRNASQSTYPLQTRKTATSFNPEFHRDHTKHGTKSDCIVPYCVKVLAVWWNETERGKKIKKETRKLKETALPLPCHGHCQTLPAGSTRYMQPLPIHCCGPEAVRLRKLYSS